MQTVRTFIGTPVVIPDEVRIILEQLKGELGDEPIKWVPLSQSHVTLRFLGETDETVVPYISNALEEELSDLRKQLVGIDEIRLFGPKKAPSVIWINFDDGDFFRMLKERVDMALRSLLPDTNIKYFVSHLTIGRVKSVKDLEGFTRIIDYYSSKVIGKTEIDRVIFYESVLQKKGPLYSPLHTIMLK